MWDTANVDEMNVLRQFGPKGEKLASKVGATDPKGDVIGQYYDKTASADQVIMHTKLAERVMETTVAEMGVKPAELTTSLQTLSQEIANNEKLRGEFKELCKTVQGIRDGSFSDISSGVGSAISHGIAPALASLATGPAAGVSLGILVATTVVPMAAEAAYDKKLKKQGVAVDQSTATMEKNFNHTVGVFLDVCSKQPEYAKEKEFLQTAKVATEHSKGTKTSEELLADTRMLREYKTADPQTRKYIEQNLKINDAAIQKKTQQLWDTLPDSPPPLPKEKKPGKLDSIKNFFTKDDSKSKAELAEKKLTEKRTALSTNIDALVSKKETTKSILGKDTPEEGKTVRFHVADSAKAAAKGETSSQGKDTLKVLVKPEEAEFSQGRKNKELKGRVINSTSEESRLPTWAKSSQKSAEKSYSGPGR